MTDAEDREPAPDLPQTGRCMCEAIVFEVAEPLLGALYCHCHRCQQRTGSSYSVSALTVPGSHRAPCRARPALVGGER
jgi:hypothetical protein